MAYSPNYCTLLAKTLTDTWLQLVLGRNDVGRAGVLFNQITVEYAKNNDAGWTAYVPLAAEWNEIGNGGYELSIGAGEFTVVGHYIIRVSELAGAPFDDTFLFVEVSARLIDDVAVPGDAMTLTPAAVLALVDDIWDEDIVAAHGGADTSGLLLRALGALISQRGNNATLNEILGVVDAVGVDLPAQIDTELTAAHGAGAWNAAGGGDWTLAERRQIRFRLAMDGVQVNPVTNTGTIEELSTQAGVRGTDNIFDTVTDIADKQDDMEVTLDDVALRVTDIHGVTTGRWQILDNQWIFYDEANNEIFRFNLLDEDGQPSERNIFERRPV